MKKIALILLLIHSIFAANGQTMNVAWLRQAGGPDWENVTGVTGLGNGQLLISGAFYGEVFFNKDTLKSKGSRDIFIANYFPDGTLKKVVSFGGEAFDYTRKIIPFGKDEAVFVIKFEGKTELNGKVIKGNLLNNLLITRVDGNLIPVSFKSLSCSGDLDITVLKTYTNGDLLFSGWFTDTLLIDDNKIFSKGGGKDIFIGRMAENGKLKWVRAYGEKGDDMPFSYITGEEVNTLAGLSESGAYSGFSSPNQDTDKLNYLFISQISEGDLKEKIFYPLSGRSIFPVDALKDSSKIWILMNFSNSVSVADDDYFYSRGKRDVLLLRFDTEDGSVKHFQLGGSGDEQANSLMKLGKYIYVTGFYNGELSFGGKEIKSGNEGTDVFIATINEECLPDSITTFSGAGNEFFCAGFASESGLFVAGEFTNSINIGDYEITSFGNEDIFIARLENCSLQNPLKVEVGLINNTYDEKEWELDAGEGYASYNWSDGFSTSRYFTTKEPGNYSITVTDLWGCRYSKEVNLHSDKDGQKSIDLGELNQDFKLYPSITSTFVYWNPSSTWEKGVTDVRVYDFNGSQIKTEKIRKLENSTYKVDFTSEPPGTYFVEVSGSSFKAIARVTVIN